MISPAIRVRAAWTILVVCIVGWPATSLTVFSGEPQAVIGLSWFALILSALNIVATADVRKVHDDE